MTRRTQSLVPHYRDISKKRRKTEELDGSELKAGITTEIYQKRGEK
jgi:hypothetical protein